MDIIRIFVYRFLSSYIYYSNNSNYNSTNFKDNSTITGIITIDIIDIVINYFNIHLYIIMINHSKIIIITIIRIAIVAPSNWNNFNNFDNFNNLNINRNQLNLNI